MNLDILSSGGWLQVNVALIRRFGLACAAYVAAASDALMAAVAGGGVDSEGFFKLDRAAISDRVGLSLKEQEGCEGILESQGLLKKKPASPSEISIDAGGLVDLLRQSSADAPKAQPKASAQQQKPDVKAIYIAKALKAKVKERDIEVRQALYEWVDSVSPKANAATVAHFEADLNAYAKDKKAKLELIKLASIYGYRDFGWAKERYEKSHGAESRQKIASSLSEVDEERTF